MWFKFGVVKTKGTKIIGWHKYENAFDFVLNLIPKHFGFYLWIEWGV